MTKGDIIKSYRTMSAGEQQGFDNWLKVNAMIGSLFAGCLMAMAIAGSDLSVSNTASAKEAQATSAPRIDRFDAASPSEMMIRYAPDRLPVEQVDSPF